MKDYYKKNTWFNIYTKTILPIFGFLNILSLIYTYINMDFSLIINIPLFVVGISLDVIFCILTIKTIISVLKKEENTVKLIIGLLGYNWCYKALVVGFNSVSNYFLISAFIFVVYSIYYIPSLIYFYHRKDYFLYNEIFENISKKEAENENN